LIGVGLAVPRPTLPLLKMLKSVEVAVPAVDEPTEKSVEAECEAKSPPAKRFKSAVGVVVPTPTLPIGEIKSVEVPLIVVPLFA